MTDEESSLSVVCSGAGDEAGAVRAFDVSPGGETTPLATTAVADPSFVAVHPSRQYLYAVERIAGGTVSAFRFDAETGAVTLLNRQSSEGGAPCYVSVDPDGEFVYATNYQGGTVAAFPVGNDGRLAAASDVVRHEGSGADPDRQSAPHPHSVLPGPEGKYLYVPDLGTDRIAIYRPDRATGELRPADPPATTLHNKAGPRHLAFHPNGEFAYVVNELDSTLTVLERDPATGALDPVRTVEALPSGFDGDNRTADVHVHPSGRWVYATNRGHDSVVTFAVAADGAEVRLVDHASTRGETPRTFAVAPDGRHLVVANQHGENIVGFAVDEETGLPELVSDVSVPKPVCVALPRLS